MALWQDLEAEVVLQLAVTIVVGVPLLQEAKVVVFHQLEVVMHLEEVVEAEVCHKLEVEAVHPVLAVGKDRKPEAEVGRHVAAEAEVFRRLIVGAEVAVHHHKQKAVVVVQVYHRPKIAVEVKVCLP